MVKIRTQYIFCGSEKSRVIVWVTLRINLFQTRAKMSCLWFDVISILIEKRLSFKEVDVHSTDVIQIKDVNWLNSMTRCLRGKQMTQILMTYPRYLKKMSVQNIKYSSLKDLVHDISIEMIPDFLLPSSHTDWWILRLHTYYVCVRTKEDVNPTVNFILWNKDHEKHCLEIFSLPVK